MEIFPDKDTGCYNIPFEEPPEPEPVGWLSSMKSSVLRVFGHDASPGTQAHLEVGVDRDCFLGATQHPYFTDVQRKKLKELAELAKSQTIADKSFYQAQSYAQSYQQLGREEDRAQVPIWVDPALDDEWKRCLKHGIAEINKAAPGLHLYTVPTQDAAKILIHLGTEADEVYTVGNLIFHATADIYLGVDWDNKKRSATHELLHTLGFEHEHQRSDAAAARAIQPGTSASNQVIAENWIVGISRFDPFSIMLYCECQIHFIRRAGAHGDQVWELKPDTAMNMQMSELDKVGLNLMYRPCKGPGYNPKVSSKTGMVYCGRDVMEDHNTPHDPESTKCGPETGANCPACRTINTTRLKEIWGQGKWQGWSGLVYCGKPFGRRQFVLFGPQQLCGPNNGEPCDKCRKMLAI